MTDLICSTIIASFFHAINSSQIVVSQRRGKKNFVLDLLCIASHLKRRSGDGGVHINYNNTSYGVMPLL